MIRYNLGGFEANRGRIDAVRASLTGARSLAETDDPEYRSLYRSLEAAHERARGDHERVPAVGLELIEDTIRDVGVATDAIRESWPWVLDSALALGRVDTARALVERLEAMPRGHLPPFMRAELALARAARGRGGTPGGGGSARRR